MTAPQSPVTLYYNSNSYSLVAHSVLLHYDIPFTPFPMVPSSDRFSTGSRWVAADGSLSNDDYRAINPTGFVPALVVGAGATTTTITEMPAVLTYIASLAPDAKLLDGDALERAKIAQWLAWLSGTVHAAGFAGYMREGRFSDDEAAFPAIKRKAKKTIEESFARINRGLEGREFAVGNRLTVVDFNLYPFWRWAPKDEFDLSRYPTYEAYLKRIEALDGVKKALAAEHLKPTFE